MTPNAPSSLSPQARAQVSSRAPDLGTPHTLLSPGALGPSPVHFISLYCHLFPPVSPLCPFPKCPWHRPAWCLWLGPIPSSLTLDFKIPLACPLTGEL